MKFAPYQGYLMGLPVSDNHLVFKWCNGDCKVLFSVARRGDGADCHIASDKKGLRHLKQAVDDWCEFVFWLFDWCRMVLAHIGKDSIARLVKKCGFIQIATSDKGAIYMRNKA